MPAVEIPFDRVCTAVLSLLRIYGLKAFADDATDWWLEISPDDLAVVKAYAGMDWLESPDPQFHRIFGYPFRVSDTLKRDEMRLIRR